MHGKIGKLEAKLVVGGDKKIKGNDYKHILSTLAKFTSMRTLMALAIAFGSNLNQLDTNNAFLHDFMRKISTC